MSIKGGAYYCNAFTYLEENHKQFLSLFQRSCTVGLLRTKGKQGLTVLIPDKDLLKGLVDMFDSNKKESYADAIAKLKSLILLDYLPDASDFETKKSDIPTGFKRKLPVKSVSGKKILLEEGGELTPVTGFDQLPEYENVAFYTLSKQYVPVGTEATAFSHKGKPDSKTGGAETSELDRQELFKLAVKLNADEDKDAVLNMLVCLLAFLKQKPDKTEYNTVLSMCSYDVVASLFIILQPYYKNSDHYLSPSTVTAFASMINNPAKTQIACLGKSAEIYKRVISDANDDYKTLVSQIQQIQTTVVDNLAKQTADGDIIECFTRIKSAVKDKLPTREKASVLQLAAEAEFRTVYALARDDAQFNPSDFKFDMFDLTKPYFCENMDSMDTATFYSCVKLMLASDGCFYLPSDKYKETKFQSVVSCSECNITLCEAKCIINTNNDMDASELSTMVKDLGKF